MTLFFKGILCNVLVCAAVWLAYAGRSVTDKILALILPVSAFIAAGFEHCVANMYFLPLAWLLIQTGHAPADFDASPITISGIIHNLVPVTLGNIVGGAGMVGSHVLGHLSGSVRQRIFGRGVACSARLTHSTGAIFSAAGSSRSRLLDFDQAQARSENGAAPQRRSWLMMRPGLSLAIPFTSTADTTLSIEELVPPVRPRPSPARLLTWPNLIGQSTCNERP